MQLFLAGPLKCMCRFERLIDFEGSNDHVNNYSSGPVNFNVLFTPL